MKLILLTLPLMLSIIVFCDINTVHNCQDLGCNYNAEEDVSKLIDCKPDGRRISIMFNGNGCDDWNEHTDTIESSVGHPCCSQETSLNANAAVISMPMPQPQIVGGTTTNWETYPFIVLVNGNCGGSVLRKSSPAMILTAAHCFKNFYSKNIKIGADAYNSNGVEVVTKQIDSFVIHPKYNPYNVNNDIAILWINGAIESLNPFFPIEEVEINPLLVLMNNEVLSVIGYGYKQEVGPETNTIEVADVNYITDTECEKHWPGQITNKMCTLKDGKTFCDGDSGGPLMKKGSLKQVGIVSFTSKCDPKFPAVYTDVGDYAQWINANKLLQAQPSIISAEVYAYCYKGIFSISYDGGNNYEHFEDRLGSSDKYKAIGFPIPVVTTDTKLKFKCKSDGANKGFIATIIDYKNKKEINTDAFEIGWSFTGYANANDLTYTKQTADPWKTNNFQSSNIQSSAEFVWETGKSEMTFYYQFKYDQL